MTLGPRLDRCKIVLLIVVILWTTDRCAAQHDGYPRPYHAVASAPHFDSAVTQPADARATSPYVATSPHVDAAVAPSPYRPAVIQSARQSAAHFRSVARSDVSLIAEIASENAHFVDQWAGLAETYNALAGRVGEATLRLDTTARDLDDVRAKLAHYGLTPTVGILLRHKKDQLDTWQVNGSSTVQATDELGRSRQRQLELEMVRFDGADVVGQSAELMAAAGQDANDYRQAALSSQLQELLYQRSQWLRALRQGYQDYQQKLGELDSAATASAKLADEYRALIDRHITWIRSDEPLEIDDLRDLKAGIASLFDSRRSAEFGYSLNRKFEANRAAGIGLLVCLVFILLARWRAKSWLIEIGSGKRMRGATAELRNVAAGVLTTLVAAAIPAALYAIARWLAKGVVFESTLHASAGFYAASLVVLLVELPRQLLCNHGYLDRHAGIQLPRRQRAMAYLTLIGLGLVLSAYVVTQATLIDHGMWRDSVARCGFIAALVLVAWTAHLSLRPTGGFLEPLIARFGGSILHRLRFVAYLIGVGFPLLMAALSALGYGFTANVLVTRAIITLAGLLVAATLWPSIKILSAEAWRLLTGPRSVRRFDEYGEIKGDSVSGVMGDHYLELKHHLAFLFQCALLVGMVASIGWVWIDVFPNVRMGNPVVWTVHDTITSRSVDAAGQAILRSSVEATPVTALHLLLAGATLFVAFQLAKLLPSLFDALVLQRVSFDEGMEHFSLVLGRCLLFGIGCVIACNWIGLRWQTIQWLAVGLMIGLGFGLQDMVRNLFGGLVVLFEKPARLGDLITVGRVTGRVAAQKIRTTVLSDEDGREVIIPNKNFISEEIVNWMGAGRLRVIPIEVAVKRDERPADVCRTLQQLVIEQPDVLLAPAPQATLVCIGKNSQRIEVRAWIEDGRDAARFRDVLLKVVTKFLRDKELLAANQPSQPPLDEPSVAGRSGLLGSRAMQSRKRSA
ncbi:MAG: mechanosensitive ion channel domain-containing protein [Planctomycetaceae bacterium]